MIISPPPRPPEPYRSPGLSLAATVTSRSGPSPMFVTRTLNSTGRPFETLSALGFCSIFSRGWTTLVVAMLPVWNQTEAPCSSGPVFTGSTLTAISFTDPAGIVSSDQVSDGPLDLGLGLAGDVFQSLGQLVADADLHRVRGAGVADHKADGRGQVQVHARRRLDVDGDRDRLLARREPVGRRSGLAGRRCRAVGTREGRVGGRPRRDVRSSANRRRAARGSSELIGDKAGTTPPCRPRATGPVDCRPVAIPGRRPSPWDRSSRLSDFV